MLVPLVQPYRKHPRPRTKAAPAALTLVAAVYDGPAATVTLTFDRAIDVATIHVAAVEVSDWSYWGAVMRGDPAGTTALVGPDAVRVPLVQIGDATHGGVTLTATAGNGIVAADDGGTWAGVSELPLPFAG